MKANQMKIVGVVSLLTAATLIEAMGSPYPGNHLLAAAPVPGAEGVGTGGGDGDAEDAYVRKLQAELGTPLEIGGSAQAPVVVQTPKQVKNGKKKLKGKVQGSQIVVTSEEEAVEEEAPVELSEEADLAEVEALEEMAPLPPRRMDLPFELRSGPARPLREDIFSELSAWCSRVAKVLSRERRNALIIARQHRLGQGDGSKLVQARRKLQSALIAVYRSLNVDPDIGGPLTWTLVKRGLELNAILGNADQSVRAKKARYDFLDQYVKFIIKMERELDSRYYLAYWYHWYPRCHYSCHDEWADYRDFEAIYVDYVREHLNFLSDKFLLEAHAPYTVSGTRIVPIGKSNYVTKLAERITAYSAQDLMETLYVYRDASLIWDLIDISSDLRDGYYVGPGRFDHLKSDIDCVVGHLDQNQFRTSCRYFDDF